MRELFNNFLSAGHSFSKNENLKKFRFSLLNIFMLVSLIFIILHLFALFFGLLEYSQPFFISLSVFVVLAIPFQYSLRIKKSYYFLVVNFFLLASASLFYFVLLTHPEDEFRLIAFFLLLLIAFVLRGRLFGILFSFLIFLSIFFIQKNFDLNLSSYAFATFFTFFIIFAIFLYFFMQKIEKDEIEFKRLNEQLKKKVFTEVQEREKQEQMLIQQYKMAKIGELLDVIIHQWKQPLMGINAIVMNINTSTMMKDNGKEIEKKVNELVELTSYMSTTIDDFKTLLREDKVKTEFPLRKAILFALEVCETSLFDIKVDLKVSKEAVFYGSKNKFIQVIIILLNNAIEVLALKNIEHKELCIYVEDSSSLSISIEDNGGGIDKSDLPHIFEAYFSTKKSTGGRGLGLYIAKVIVEQNMQGEISVINTKKGSKFIIKL